jgi:Lrp/AsnC family transcriptional regulator, leucine-responsive regulatory protein
MDDIDSKILRHLINDGRITNARLAKAVGLSESATLDRVRRLEAGGVIQGYTLVAEPARLGRGLEVLMTFTLKNQGPEDIQRFEEAMRGLDEVLSCAQVLGRFDFVAHVAVRDIDALQRFIGEKLVALGLIQRMESLTVLRTIKRYRPPTPAQETEP